MFSIIKTLIIIILGYFEMNQNAIDPLQLALYIIFNHLYCTYILLFVIKATMMSSLVLKKSGLGIQIKGHANVYPGSEQRGTY